MMKVQELLKARKVIASRYEDILCQLREEHEELLKVLSDAWCAENPAEQPVPNGTRVLIDRFKCHGTVIGSRRILDVDVDQYEGSEGDLFTLAPSVLWVHIVQPDPTPKGKVRDAIEMASMYLVDEGRWYSRTTLYVEDDE